MQLCANGSSCDLPCDEAAHGNGDGDGDGDDDGSSNDDGDAPDCAPLRRVLTVLPDRSLVRGDEARGDEENGPRSKHSAALRSRSFY